MQPAGQGTAGRPTARQRSTELHSTEQSSSGRRTTVGLDRVVVIDRPSNPGNLGAIIRTCDAFRIDAVILTGHGVDPYDPKTITASRGTVFSVPVVSVESNSQLEDLIAQLRRAHEKFGVYGSSGMSGANIQEMHLERSFCLFVGNETFGMSDFLKSICDEVIRIGMHGFASSLNAACAASIMLYELTKTNGRPTG